MITVTRTKPNGNTAVTATNGNNNNSNSKVGLSLAKQQNSGRILVTKVHANSLFANSGIQAGQELVSVNGLTVVGLPVLQVVDLLKTQSTISLVVCPTTSSGGEDEIDACELGQFLVNPCWFLYLKVKNFLAFGNKTQSVPDAGMEKTLWMSNLQQFIYLTSFYSVWWVVFTQAIPLNQTQQHLSTPHEVFTKMLFVLAVLSWIAAKYASPGNITSQTIPKFDNYHYDGILYQPAVCPTLNIRKLARSKFDRYTQQHVPRFDHFCGWLGNTIGEENYRFFMAFLALHAIMVVYGFASVGYLLYQEALLLRQMNPGTSLLTVAYHHPALLAVCVWNLLASIPTTMFFLFHLRLISKGMTTNEYYKWKQIYKTSASSDNASSADIERASFSATGGHSYNLGFMANLHEVCFPRSLRMELHLGYKES